MLFRSAEQATEVFAELISGDFDKEREEAEEAATEEGGVYKRVLLPEPDAPKLQKVLAQAGVGSRRDIEQMIEDGRIEVNDQVAHIGQRISFGDRIKVAGRPIKVRIAPPAARILAYHKPTGEVVTHDDPQGRPTVFRRLPRLHNGKWMSVGRLDLNTEGLLLFTNSGELANQLMHPRFGVEREYAVRVLGSLGEDARNKLLTGVEIDCNSVCAAFWIASLASGCYLMHASRTLWPTDYASSPAYFADSTVDCLDAEEALTEIDAILPAISGETTELTASMVPETVREASFVLLNSVTSQ